MSRFVKPETVTLTLENGDRLIVRKELTCGEARQANARIYVMGEDGRRRVDPLLIGLGTVIAYLVDWTLADDDGQIVAIRGLPIDDLIPILDSLDSDSFAEIRRAIETHELAMVQARQEKKTTRSTASGSAATFTSVN
jgi:hypothetical protein